VIFDNTRGVDDSLDVKGMDNLQNSISFFGCATGAERFRIQEPS
jgi:hypothetical protein